MPKPKNLKLWAWGLLAAVIAAVSQTAYTLLTAPNLVMSHWRELLPGVLIAAAVAAAAYMRDNRLPIPGEVETETAVTVTVTETQTPAAPEQ
jgi:hypothetical protein